MIILKILNKKESEDLFIHILFLSILQRELKISSKIELNIKYSNVNKNKIFKHYLIFKIPIT